MRRRRFQWMSVLATVMLIVQAITLPAPLAHAQTASYTVTDLGGLDGGSSATAINIVGQIVGESTTDPPLNPSHAFLWQTGAMSDLGTLGGLWSEANGINNQGQVVGQSYMNTATNSPYHAFLWQAGTMSDLDTLGGQSSTANGINNLSQVVGQSNTSTGGSHAFLWSTGTMSDLDSLSGPNGLSLANAINDAGQVVGESSTDTGDDHAFLWQSGTMNDLGSLGGASRAMAINSVGQVVGDSSTVPGGSGAHAFLWQSGTMSDLGTLGGQASWAYAINRIGQVVGMSNTDALVDHAFLWSETGGMTDLNSLLPPNSGWTLYSATGINESGQIVGVGTHNNDSHAFLLTPVMQPSGTEVTAVHPSSGPTTGGTTVILSGSGFTGATGVSFGNTAAASFNVDSDAQITAVSPAHAAGAVDVTVTTPGGTSQVSSADEFTYVAPSVQAPSITSIIPNTGPITGGTSVTITGSGFTGATTVSFGDNPAQISNPHSDTQITAVSPAHTVGAVDVTVTTPGGTSQVSSADQFTYVTTTIAYYALGDSIASGHGLMDDYSNGRGDECHRSYSESYPEKVKEQLATDYTVAFDLVACSGASFNASTNIAKCLNRKVNPERGNCSLLDFDAQIKYLDGKINDDQPTIVSITVGVDQFPWTDPVQMTRWLTESNAAFQNDMQTLDQTILTDLDESVRHLMVDHPNASVVITGYHDPFNQQSWIFDLADTILPGGGFMHNALGLIGLTHGGFSLPLSSYFNRRATGTHPTSDGVCDPGYNDCYQRSIMAITMLNNTLQTVAQNNSTRFSGRVAYASVFEEFQQHVAPTPQCGSSPDAPGGSSSDAPKLSDSWIQYPGESGVNGPQSPALEVALGNPFGPILRLVGVPPTGDCFHPNEDGANAYANAVVQAIHQLDSWKP